MPYYPQTPSYAPPNPLSFRNILGRNGGFEVWQRGAGGSAAFAVAGASRYTADGWWVSTTPATTVSQEIGIATGSRYSMRIQRNAGQATGGVFFEFPLDSDEVAMMRGSIVTLSLTLRAGANFSPAGGNITVYLFTGTGAPTKGDLFTGTVAVITLPIAVTTNATRYSGTASAVVPAGATQASVYTMITHVGTAGADDSLYVDDVQLEIGSVATPFERRPFESELLACRRHFWKTFAYDVAPITFANDYGNALTFAQAVVALAAQFGNPLRFPVPMRAVPTVVLFNPGAAGAQIRNANIGVDWNTTSVSAGQHGMYVTGNAPAGSAAGNLAAVHVTADAGI